MMRPPWPADGSDVLVLWREWGMDPYNDFHFLVLSREIKGIWNILYRDDIA